MKVDEFFVGFLLPLVRGGPLHVGAPLGRSGLAALRARPPSPSLEGELLEARAAVCGELLLDPIPPPLDVDAWRLAVAVHDLLFFFHPIAGTLAARGGRLESVAEYAARLARLDPTDDPDALVARHSMLHLLPSLQRTDVRVSFWVGKREFRGEEPPRRLTAWPGLRRVREERWRVGCFAEAASHPATAETVRAILDASPLTDLLHPVRIEPRFELGRHCSALRSAALCRAVAYRWLDDEERVAGALAASCLAEIDGRTDAPPDEDPRARARFACALLAHLHLCHLLAPPDDGSRDRGAPRLRGRLAPVARLTASTDPAVRDYYGLFAAIDRALPELAAPPDVRRDVKLQRRLDEHVAACVATAGAARITELRGLLTRKLLDEAPLASPPSLP